MQTSPASVQNAYKIWICREEGSCWACKAARYGGASKDSLNTIKKLPYRVYTSAANVSKELE